MLEVGTQTFIIKQIVNMLKRLKNTINDIFQQPKVQKEQDIVPVKFVSKIM